MEAPLGLSALIVRAAALAASRDRALLAIVGPPGSGKSLLARQVAEAIGQPPGWSSRPAGRAPTFLPPRDDAKAEGCVAVAQGFEPWEAYTSHAFEACSLGRSDTPPSTRVPAVGKPHVSVAAQRIRRAAHYIPPRARRRRPADDD